MCQVLLLGCCVNSPPSWTHLTKQSLWTPLDIYAFLVGCFAPFLVNRVFALSAIRGQGGRLIPFCGPNRIQSEFVGLSMTSGPPIPDFVHPKGPLELLFSCQPSDSFQKTFFFDPLNTLGFSSPLAVATPPLSWPPSHLEALCQWYALDTPLSITPFL